MKNWKNNKTKQKDEDEQNRTNKKSNDRRSVTIQIIKRII